MTATAIADGRVVYEGGETAVFVLTDNNLREGGRPRDPLETVLNVDSAKAAYLSVTPVDTIPCLTDDGERIDAYISGDHLKNFRSRPATALGNWLKLRCRALPGDEVHARWEDTDADGYGRVLRLRYVRTHAPPDESATVEQRRLERETEEAVAAELAAAGVAYQRQVRVPSGVIDLLTPDALYEVKTFLTRDDLYRATGQLFCYRTETANGDALRLVVIGRQTRETAALIPVLAKLGIEVRLWQ